MGEDWFFQWKYRPLLCRVARGAAAAAGAAVAAATAGRNTVSGPTSDLLNQNLFSQDPQTTPLCIQV